MRHKILGFPVILSLLFLALPAHAHEAGQWVYRVGVGTVQPDDRNLVLDETTFIEVDGGTSATFTLTYFFTRNLAFDVLAAFPFNHDVVLVADGVGAKVAETNHLPPTLSLQYHFLPEGDLRPYVGLGVNWTTFFNTDTIDDLADAGVGLELDDSFGMAAQVGADYLIGEHWLINLDVRYLDIETDATLGGAEVGSVAIEPWVYSLSVGYRF